MTGNIENQKTAFFDGFIAALLWSSTSDEGESLDGFDVADITRQRLREYTDAWCDVNSDSLAVYVFNIAMQNNTGNPPAMLRAAYRSAGHDFALTANGHGTGFWDRGIEELGERLTASAKADYRRTPTGYSVHISMGRARWNKLPGMNFSLETYTCIGAIMSSWKHSGQTPPERLGSVFDAYIGGDELVYVAGFES